MKLDLRDITKRFGTLVANDRISLTVEPGEIHCLLGENGAGKSTLMNVLYGLYQADEGEILLDDDVQQFTGPGDAIAAGIGMVHQHFMLIPVFTVAENVMLGNETTGFAGTLDLDAARQRVHEISERFGFHVDPDALVEDLPVGVQQRVEIIKALSRDAQVLVFDEPTAVLTPQETDELMEIMRQLKEAGKAIVFITHKLREVREVADRITVIRLGKVVGEAEPTRQQRRARLADGRPAGRADGAQGPAARSARTTLVVDGPPRHRRARPRARRRRQLHDPRRRGPRRRRRAGQRPDRADRGAAGAAGPRRRARSASTARSSSAARSARSSTPASASSPRTAGRRPGRRVHDRREPHAQPQLRRAVRPARHPPAGPARRVRQGEAQGVRRPGPGHRPPWPASSPAATSRRSWWPASSRATCGCSSPPSRPAASTSGSIEFIHKQIVATRDAGVPVLVVSTELDEVVALADRIMVLYRGRIVGIVPGRHTPRGARPDDDRRAPEGAWIA